MAQMATELPEKRIDVILYTAEEVVLDDREHSWHT